jgi:hypothetical protein
MREWPGSELQMGEPKSLVILGHIWKQEVV